MNIKSSIDCINAGEKIFRTLIFSWKRFTKSSFLWRSKYDCDRWIRWWKRRLKKLNSKSILKRTKSRFLIMDNPIWSNDIPKSPASIENRRRRSFCFKIMSKRIWFNKGNPRPSVCSTKLSIKIMINILLKGRNNERCFFRSSFLFFSISFICFFTVISWNRFCCGFSMSTMPFHFFLKSSLVRTLLP